MLNIAIADGGLDEHDDHFPDGRRRLAEVLAQRPVEFFEALVDWTEAAEAAEGVGRRRLEDTYAASLLFVNRLFNKVTWLSGLSDLTVLCFTDMNSSARNSEVKIEKYLHICRT